MQDTEKTEAETEDTEPVAQEEPKPKQPLELVAEYMSFYSSMVGNHVSLNDDLSGSEKIALLRLAGFVISQAHAMVNAEIASWPDAAGVAALPHHVPTCMAAAEIYAATILGKTQDAPVLETAAEAAKTLAAEEPKIVEPGPEKNRHARRAEAAKQ